MSLLQLFENGRSLLRRIVRTAVECQQHEVGGSHEIQQVRLEVAVGDRRRVDELHRHVFPRHHAGQRLARGEGGSPRLPARPSSALSECGSCLRLGPPTITAVAAPCRGNLKCLPTDLGACFSAAISPRTSLILVLMSAWSFSVPLVLGDELQHQIEAVQPLLRRLRAAERLFGLLILRREIGGHFLVPSPPSAGERVRVRGHVPHSAPLTLTLPPHRNVGRGDKR